MSDYLRIKRQLEEERAEQYARAGRLALIEEQLADLGYGILDEAKEALEEMKARRDQKQRELEERWNEYQNNRPSDSQG